MYFGAVKAGVVQRPRLTGACDAFSFPFHPMKERHFELFFHLSGSRPLLFSYFPQLRHPGQERGVRQANAVQP